MKFNFYLILLLLLVLPALGFSQGNWIDVGSVTDVEQKLQASDDNRKNNQEITFAIPEHPGATVKINLAKMESTQVR